MVRTKKQRRSPDWADAQIMGLYGLAYTSTDKPKNKRHYQQAPASAWAKLLKENETGPDSRQEQFDEKG